MNHTLQKHCQNLKTALLELNASGLDGFEGLLKVALSEILGIPVRLAKSGTQRGIDGKTVYEADGLFFEAKRYDGKIPRTEIISKIADIKRDNIYPDYIWILGATTQVSTQDADDLKNDAKDAGFSVLILDWSEDIIPELAIALVHGGHKVEQFLKDQISDSSLSNKAIKSLKEISKKIDLEKTKHKLLSGLNGSAQAIFFAKQANKQWLIDSFSDQEKARYRFGQPLAPKDPNLNKLLPRQNIVSQVLTDINSNNIICILGKEGAGKSWIAAQCWLSMPEKPLYIFLSAETFINFESGSARDFLFDKIILQTEGNLNDTSIKQWERRFNYWKNNKTERINLFLIIDGINQKPSIEWAKIINKIVGELSSYGVKVLITTRTSFFNEKVKKKIIGNIKEVKVPDWTNTERDEILATKNINHSLLSASVAQSLLNPRLLNIAINLFDKETIQNINELDVNRILLEHIRLMEQDSYEQSTSRNFLNHLKKHAQKIIERLANNETDDLTLFENDLNDVAEGRFFEIIEDELNTYRLTDAGLPLALALEIIFYLKKIERNNKNLDEGLAKIIEPINALDKTADIIIASLTILIIEEDYYSNNILNSLVNSFLTLQNVDETKFPVFAKLAENKVSDFLNILEKLCLNSGNQPNFNWIKKSIMCIHSNVPAWPLIEKQIKKWLSFHSLSPKKRLTFAARKDDIKRLEEIKENKNEIKKKLNELSSNEKIILQNLNLLEDGDIDNLSITAFHIIAGKPIASFAENFINWSFTSSLNSSYQNPHNDFIDLIRFNCVDWEETRRNLLTKASIFNQTDISAVGKRSYIRILNATGLSEDEILAEKIVQQLKSDQSSIGSWRLIEDYCASDPCDPKSLPPKNIDKTGEECSHIDLNQIWNSRNQTKENHFLNDVQTGLARFNPEIVITTYRKLIANILERSEYSLRCGVLNIDQHNVLLKEEHVLKLLELHKTAKNSNKFNSLTDFNKNIVHQSFIILAAPFISPIEQIQHLLSLPSDEIVFLNLIDSMQTISIDELDKILLGPLEEHQILNLLFYTNRKHLPLTNNLKIIIRNSIFSKNSIARMEAFKAIGYYQDLELLQEFINSRWTIQIENGTELEILYGSILWLLAIKLKLVNEDENIDKIDVCAYGYANDYLSKNGLKKISLFLDDIFKNIINKEIREPDLKIIENLPYNKSDHSFFSIDDKLQENPRILSESDEEFEIRQDKQHQTFEQYQEVLTNKGANILLSTMLPCDFSMIVNSNPELRNNWFNIFYNLSKTDTAKFYNFILLLAFSYSEIDVDKAKLLWDKTKNIEPFSKVTVGEAKIPLELMSIWSGKRSSKLDEFRYHTLDIALNDKQIHRAVLAATVNNNQAVIVDYIKLKLKRIEPSQKARGLLVAGCLDSNSFSDSILKKHMNDKGLTGDAYKAASYMYERNKWSKYWFEQMLSAKSHEDFWRFMVLFTKIVDSRYFYWKENFSYTNTIYSKFYVSFSNDIKNRCQKWEKMREEKLLGIAPPNPIYFL
jgi:hypothetical protein